MKHISLALVLLMASCSKAPVDHRNVMQGALSDLLDRSNDDSFVIFEDSRSAEFVQFSVTTNQTLLLDLPEQPLDPEEMHRARRIFARHGVELKTLTLYGRPDGMTVDEWLSAGKPLGEPSGSISSFQMDFGVDVTRAASLSLQVFQDVYQIKDLHLRVIEN